MKTDKCGTRRKPWTEHPAMLWPVSPTMTTPKSFSLHFYGVEKYSFHWTETKQVKFWDAEAGPFLLQSSGSAWLSLRQDMQTRHLRTQAVIVSSEESRAFSERLGTTISSIQHHVGASSPSLLLLSHLGCLSRSVSPWSLGALKCAFLKGCNATWCACLGLVQVALERDLYSGEQSNQTTPN